MTIVANIAHKPFPVLAKKVVRLWHLVCILRLCSYKEVGGEEKNEVTAIIMMIAKEPMLQVHHAGV